MGFLGRGLISGVSSIFYLVTDKGFAAVFPSATYWAQLATSGDGEGLAVFLGVDVLGEPVFEGAAHFCNAILVCGIVDEVGAFVGVILEVVEFVGPLGVTMDVFPLVGADHSCGAVFVINYYVLTAGIRLAEEGR